MVVQTLGIKAQLEKMGHWGHAFVSSPASVSGLFFCEQLIPTQMFLYDILSVCGPKSMELKNEHHNLWICEDNRPLLPRIISDMSFITPR